MAAPALIASSSRKSLATVFAYSLLLLVTIFFDLLHRFFDVFLVRFLHRVSPLFLRPAVVAWVGLFGFGIFIELGRVLLRLSSVNALVDQDAGSITLRSVVIYGDRRPVQLGFGRSTVE